MATSGSGKRFELCRNLTGLSQTEAARRMGIGTSSLSNYENDVKLPGMIAIKKMAQTYGISADFLLGLTDETDLRGGGHIQL